MALRSPLTSRRKPPVRRRSGEVHARPQRGASVTATLAATVSARRAGGPQDAALYRCACGCDFYAAVSTSVGCPVCGGGQEW